MLDHTAKLIVENIDNTGAGFEIDILFENGLGFGGVTSLVAARKFATVFFCRSWPFLDLTSLVDAFSHATGFSSENDRPEFDKPCCCMKACYNPFLHKNAIDRISLTSGRE